MSDVRDVNDAHIGKTPMQAAFDEYWQAEGPATGDKGRAYDAFAQGWDAGKNYRQPEVDALHRAITRLDDVGTEKSRLLGQALDGVNKLVHLVEGLAIARGDLDNNTVRELNEIARTLGEGQ